MSCCPSSPCSSPSAGPRPCRRWLRPRSEPSSAGFGTGSSPRSWSPRPRASSPRRASRHRIMDGGPGKNPVPIVGAGQADVRDHGRRQQRLPGPAGQGSRGRRGRRDASPARPLQLHHPREPRRSRPEAEGPRGQDRRNAVRRRDLPESVREEARDRPLQGEGGGRSGQRRAAPGRARRLLHRVGDQPALPHRAGDRQARRGAAPQGEDLEGDALRRLWHPQLFRRHLRHGQDRPGESRSREALRARAGARHAVHPR